MLQEKNDQVPRTKFRGRRRSWYNPGIARSCQVGTGALPSFPLPDLRPGVNSGERVGSVKPDPSRIASIGRRGVGSARDPMGLIYLAPVSTESLF